MKNQRAIAHTFMVWLMAFSAMPVAMTGAQSITSTESAEPQTCFVSKERTFVLPASLTMAQKGYLSELCDKVMRFQNRLLGANPMEQPTTIEATEFENAKLLYELDRQHVASMSVLIEEAVAVQPFPEDAFWIAWLNERRAYREETEPLIHRQAELILGKLQREDQARVVVRPSSAGLK